MVGEGHGAHGEPEIRPLLDSGSHAEGGADEKAGAAFSGILHGFYGFCKLLAGKGLPLGGEHAEPGPFGNPGENGIRLLFQSRSDFGRGGVLRQAAFRQFQKAEFAVPPQPLGVFRRSRNVERLLQLTHGDQCDIKHKKPQLSKK